MRRVAAAFIGAKILGKRKVGWGQENPCREGGISFVVGRCGRFRRRVLTTLCRKLQTETKNAGGEGRGGGGRGKKYKGGGNARS